MAPEAHQETLRRLDEFVDGRLSPAHSRAVEQHLASCPACRDELKKLGRILDEATRLKDCPIKPERDLWPGILARLEERAESGAEVPAGFGEPALRGASAVEAGSAPFPASLRSSTETDRPAIRSRFTRWVGTPRLSVRLAWAAAVLLILASTATIIVRSRLQPGSPGGLDPAVAQSIELMESEASKARADVFPALSSRSRESPGGPESEFERNLSLLDQAIRDSRAALEAAPQDRGLQRSLLGVYQKQLDLLRWAARVLQQTS